MHYHQVYLLLRSALRAYLFFSPTISSTIDIIHQRPRHGQSAFASCKGPFGIQQRRKSPGSPRQLLPEVLSS